MPLAFDRHHPVGVTENSPAFQRWDRSQGVPTPEGTAEAAVVSRPFGTYPAGRGHPALKRWAIIVCPSGTGAEPRLSDGDNSSNPSGIGQECPRSDFGGGAEMRPVFASVLLSGPQTRRC